jgi:hypothetical protein
MRALATIAAVTLLAGSAAFIGVPRAFAQANCEDPRVNTEACKRERAAAAQAKSQGELRTKGQDQYQENALRRCDNQPEGPARESCRQRVMGQGNTTMSGSVEGGGRVKRNEMPVTPPDAAKK